jgi:hypothetical protein
MPRHQSVYFFTMSLGSNCHRINGGDGVELCFFCMPPCIKAVEQGEVGSQLFLSQARMPPPREDHQQSPHGRRMRAALGGGRVTPRVEVDP